MHKFKTVWKSTQIDIVKSVFKLSTVYNGCSKEDISSFWYSFTNSSWWQLLRTQVQLFQQRESRFKSLKFLNHHISIIVTGKRVNKGIGLKLEIPVDYFFHRYNRVIEWFKESIENLYTIWWNMSCKLRVTSWTLKSKS